MNLIIGLNKDMDKAMEIVHDYLPNKRVSIDNNLYGSRCFIDVNLEGKKSAAYKEFYNNMARAVLDIILKIYSEDIINEVYIFIEMI